MVLVLVYLTRDVRSRQRQDKSVPWYDWVILLAGVTGTGFVAFFYDRALDYGFYGYLDTFGIILAVMLAVSVLEGVRRVTGWVLPLIIVTFLGMTMFQEYLPSLLHGKGYGLDRLGYSIYIGTGGIYGIPLGVAASILIVFLIFANLLQQAGAGKWFMNLALSVTGRMRGGPAKASVVASAFFGMISGSPSGNTATTGAFTIPLMKSTGYRTSFAGAVEAVSSTGGQLLPPVMGAVAFVMAEWLGIGYYAVVKAALIPAMLYFVVLFVSVHLQAVKEGIAVYDSEDLPSFWKTMKEGWFYIIPIAALLYFLLVRRYDPEIAGIYALPFLIGASFLAPERNNRLSPKRLWQGLVQATHNWLTVAIITAAVGMLVGSLELSGLGVKFSSFLVHLSGGNLILTVFLVGLGSLILGMGLDSLPAYMTLATLTAPALIMLGLPDISAHLFVVYWGLASFITPPVCIAVYVACGISGGNVWQTGGEAVRLGLGAYVISFAFALNPALLLIGTPAEVVQAVFTALVGSVAVASGVRGYALLAANWPQRILLISGGLFLIAPGLDNAALGLAQIVVCLTWQLISRISDKPDGYVQTGGGSQEVARVGNSIR